MNKRTTHHFVIFWIINAFVYVWKVSKVTFIVWIYRKFISIWTALRNIQHLARLLRGAEEKDGILAIPYVYNGRHYIHHVPCGDFQSQRAGLPDILDFDKEYQDAAPVGALSIEQLMSALNQIEAEPL